MICFVCICCCLILVLFIYFFFFKQKTAYEMRISDWSSDVCSSDLRIDLFLAIKLHHFLLKAGLVVLEFFLKCLHFRLYGAHCGHGGELLLRNGEHQQSDNERQNEDSHAKIADIFKEPVEHRPEEHTSELQSLMRNLYDVFCLK